jgi:carbonic anhydrase
VLNLAQSTVIFDAWARGQQVSVHGLIYGLKDGIVRNLDISIHSLNAICPAYNHALSNYTV